MITTLHDILKEYQSDMQRMESRIHESLGTDVPLIQQVSKYILGAGGKRFRPLLHLLCCVPRYDLQKRCWEDRSEG